MEIKNEEEVILNLSQCVRFKTLWNKATKCMEKLNDLSSGMSSLMFSFEDEETKREVYSAIDCLIRFRDNLKLKPKYEKLMKR